jgi:hypothetical protein
MNDVLTDQYALFGLGSVALHQGHLLDAVRLWAAADALREAAHMHLPPATRASSKYDNDLARARAQLGEALFTAAWAEGRAMSVEQAIVYALSTNGDIEPTQWSDLLGPSSQSPTRDNHRKSTLEDP